MKKFSIILLVILYAVCMIPVSAEDTSTDASVISGSRTLDGQVPVLGNQQIIKNMKSAILYEPNSDTLLYSYNPDEKLPPSSLLKILTALIAIEKGNLSDAVTVREEVLATLDKDAVSVKLTVDEVVTVKDLLYCMMVGSGNDAAVILADHVLGSQQAFVTEMNKYAMELGCTNTNFTNVHGLHEENQYTTARDVARFLSYAIANSQFCEIFEAKEYTVPATNKSEERILSSQNYLMNNDDNVNYYDERVKGSRTAVANDRSRNIASTAQVNDMELICVVMGSESQYEKDGYSVRVFGGYNETTSLLDFGSNGYKTAQVLYPNQIVLQKPVTDGSCDLMIGTHSGAYAVIPDNVMEESLSYRYVNEVPLTAPVEKGQRVSTLQIWSGNVCISQTELYAMNRVEPAGTQFLQSDTNTQGIGILKTVLYFVGAVTIVGFLGILCISALRTFRIAKVKRQRRRNRMYHRRSR